MNEVKLCLCGCGQQVDEVHDYKFGHNFLTEGCKNRKRQSLHDANFVKEDRKKLSNRLCKCGCGQPVKYKYAFYAKGHHNKNKPAHNKGMHWKIRDDCPKKINGLSDEHCKHLSGKVGILSPLYGKKQKPESIAKMKASLSVLMSGDKNPFYGKKHTEETKKIIGAKSKVGYKVSGENHPYWLGGKSFEPYNEEFNKQLKTFIRMRDGYTCQLCGMPETENNRILSCHHIDYNKLNCLPNNLISLCNPCHIRTSKPADRNYYTCLFTDLLNKRMVTPKTYVKKSVVKKIINEENVLIPKLL